MQSNNPTRSPDKGEPTDERSTVVVSPGTDGRDTMNLENHDGDLHDALFRDLDDLQLEIDEVDTRHVEGRDPEISRELAKAKQAIHRAKQLRADEIRGSSS